MAKDYYVSLWKLMVDARSRERRARSARTCRQEVAEEREAP